MDYWFLLYCKPKQEQRAQANLAHQGIESFFPFAEFTTLNRGKRVTSLRPVFPNYLFVKLNAESGPFAAVKNTRGVSRFIAYGQKYQTVPDSLVDQLKIMEPKQLHGDTLPKQGDVVILNTDSFQNVQAIYQEPDGDTRCVLLLQLLNQEVKIIVDNTAIERTTN
ncbi:transcription/translation regulatory transformer protein RfaH [Pseudoalteromonas fenneropenaei]|uniref:Transcription/translation regulatory transformer protein RfaH n=1 Tax=Pseudoalteromonas fenneropenaei TaxID=1737459 RepID=A0ABV7CKR3_9GAMM